MPATLQRLVGCLRHWTDPERANAPSDRQLLSQFAGQRDEAAFSELVRRHAPMVFAVARRVLHDAHDAEDVSQAAFLVLARKATSVRWHESVGGWLFPVVYHLALKVRGGRERRHLHETAVGTARATEMIPERTDEMREILEEELGRLPDSYRNVLVHCCLEGRTRRETAEQLGLSANEVRGRLDRARQCLRERLRRRGLTLSAGAVTALTAPQLLAAAAPSLIAGITQAAVGFAAGATHGLASIASLKSITLATGVLHTMQTIKAKGLFLGAFLLSVLAAAALSLAGPALGDDPKNPSATKTDKDPKVEKKVEARKGARSVIVLWMNGGPSQIDTFDPKPGDANGGSFKAINTTLKGIQFSEVLPKMAKVADQLTVIRSMTHSEGDHGRSRILMRTGRSPGGAIEYPPLSSLLAKELSDGKLNVPPYVSMGGAAEGPGFLSAEFAPLVIKDGWAKLEPKVPPEEAFAKLNKDRAEAMRKGIEKAFDLTQEKKAVRDEYGQNVFGQSCLLARRLVERGVQVVEIQLGGWDTHSSNEDGVKKSCAILDPAMSMLLRDLKDRGLLDSTLVVWMGEFGRTPRINGNDGRDHWPRSFSVVLAGAGIKKGTVIGKTSADGTTIDEHPVTPAELHATICRAVGVDPAKKNKSNTNEDVPIVKDGKEVKEALK